MYNIVITGYFTHHTIYSGLTGHVYVCLARTQYHYLTLYENKLTKMRTELAGLNHCAVPFLRRAATKLVMVLSISLLQRNRVRSCVNRLLIGNNCSAKKETFAHYSNFAEINYNISAGHIILGKNFYDPLQEVKMGGHVVLIVITGRAGNLILLTELHFHDLFREEKFFLRIL